MEAAAAAYSRVHRAVHGDGHDVIERVLNTCEEMLRDRGCGSVNRVADVGDVFDSVTPAVSGWVDEEKGWDVFLLSEERVGVKVARAILEQLGKDRVAVIVSVDGPTPFTRRECEGKAVEFFTARELVVNVTHHALVPAHQIDTECTIAPELLPIVLESDPVVRYYAWPRGTRVRVMRCFGGHEPIPYVRIVAGACDV